MIPGMKQVTLRPAGGLGVLKVMIGVADLLFLGLPVALAFDHINGLLVAVMAVFCLACAAAATFLGWLGLNMRVEVEPDAVRCYYFWPKPAIIPRETIAAVKSGGMTRGGNHVPNLILVDGTARALPPLTVRTEAQGQEQAAKLRAALRDVAPIA